MPNLLNHKHEWLMHVERSNAERMQNLVTAHPPFERMTGGRASIPYSGEACVLACTWAVCSPSLWFIHSPASTTGHSSSRWHISIADQHDVHVKASALQGKLSYVLPISYNKIPHTTTVLVSSGLVNEQLCLVMTHGEAHHTSTVAVHTTECALRACRHQHCWLLNSSQLTTTQYA